MQYYQFLSALIIGGLTGGLVAVESGGSSLNKRIILSALAGIVTGLLYTILSGYLSLRAGIPIAPFHLVTNGVWKMFGYTIVTTTGAIVTELSLPEPAAKESQ